MRKVGKFLMSIVVFIVSLILMVAGMIIGGVLYAKTGAVETAGVLDFLLNMNTLSQDADYLMLCNLCYAVLGIIVFGLWYWLAFIRPFRDKPKNYTGGFNPWTILSLVIIGFGLSFIGSMIVDEIAHAAPSIGSNYQSYMTMHFGEANLQTLLYVIILAPIVEELIFRGLIYRYARHAAPFIVANIWQALLFGLVHGTLIQMIYAFIMGLVFGLLVHRGHGIRYTIVLHMIINCIGMLLGDFFEAIPQIYPGGIHALVIAGTAFAIVVFWMEFGPAPEAAADPQDPGHTGHGGYAEHTSHGGYAEHTTPGGYTEHATRSDYAEHTTLGGYAEHTTRSDYAEHTSRADHSEYSSHSSRSDELFYNVGPDDPEVPVHHNHSEHSGYRTEVEDLD